MTETEFNDNTHHPAWRAYCDTGNWVGVWHHADDYHVYGDPPDHDDAWLMASAAARDAAEDDGADHRANVHHD